jgi:hypothetical protein
MNEDLMDKPDEIGFEFRHKGILVGRCAVLSKAKNLDSKSS